MEAKDAKIDWQQKEIKTLRVKNWKMFYCMKASIGAGDREQLAFTYCLTAGMLCCCLLVLQVKPNNLRMDCFHPVFVPQVSSSSSSASDYDDDDEPFLKKLCMLLCIPQNAPECTTENQKLPLGENVPRSF